MQCSRVISDQGLRVGGNGYLIDVRLPWYRSLPLSTVEVGEVLIDGQQVDPSRIRFELEGRKYPLESMSELVSHVWYVLDSAYLHIDAPDARRGSSHDVQVTLNLYPPYIHGLKRVTRDRKTLRAE